MEVEMNKFIKLFMMVFFFNFVPFAIILLNCKGDNSESPHADEYAIARIFMSPKGPSVGETVSLNGSGSTGVDGTAIAEYRWNLVSRPANSSVALSSTIRPVVTIVPDCTGYYEVKLQVKDADDNVSDFKFFKFDVSLHPPVAIAGPDTFIDLGTTLMLDGSASYHPLGYPVSFQWYSAEDDYGFTVKPLRSQLDFVYNNIMAPVDLDEPGTYEFELHVYETDNEIEDSYDRIRVSSNPPVIESFSPVSGSEGTEVNIKGKNFSSYTSGLGGYDPGNQMWFNGVQAEITQASDSLLVTMVPEGATTGPIRVGITETNIATVSTQSFTIGSLPVAIAGPDTMINFPGAFYLDGSASYHPTGEDIYYLWQVVQKPPLAQPDLSPTTEVNPRFYSVEPGRYEIELLVSTDINYRGGDRDTMVVTAGAPAIDLFDPMSGTVGTEVTIWGTNISMEDEGNLVFFNGIQAEEGSEPAGGGVMYVVPDSATTGPISLVVIATGDTAWSNQNFEVTE
ncbi:MAG: hypothetical protein GF313_09770 [Caldithrix sp.]|nr:hypothetical protein [Caldithrix sp.]